MTSNRKKLIKNWSPNCQQYCYSQHHHHGLCQHPRAAGIGDSQPAVQTRRSWGASWMSGESQVSEPGQEGNFILTFPLCPSGFAQCGCDHK